MKKKILFINVPWTGHVNPTLVLVHALVQNGYEVTYINSKEWKEKIEETGARFKPYLNYPDGELSVAQKDTLCQMAAYSAGLRELDKYEVLIYEAMFFLGETLARQCGKKSIRVFTTFAINDHVLGEYCSHSNTWFILYLKSIRKNYTQRIARNIEITEDDVYLELSRNKANRSIVCTTRQFQIFEEEFGEDFCFSGPLLSNRITEKEKESDKTGDQKIVYISMGSILQKDRLLRTCIKAFADSEYEVIVSLGGRKSKSFSHVPKNVHMYPYVNQVDVLKRTSLFITHGGMNSIQEALYFKVPMLVFPINNDQFVNADRVAKLQLGRKMSSRFVTARQIRREAEKIIHSDSVKDALLRMKKSIDDARGVEACVELVNELLAEEDEGGQNEAR